MTTATRTRATNPAVMLVFTVDPLPGVRTVSFDSGETTVMIAVDQARRTVVVRRAGRDHQIDIPLPAPGAAATIDIRLHVAHGAIVLQAAGSAPVSLAPLTSGTALRDFRLPPGVRLRRLYDSAAPVSAAPSPGRLVPAPAERPSISVVVPSYDYARYLEARLDSIFAQTQTPAEIIVLDDGSHDDSPAVALDTAVRAGREIQLVCGAPNSGNVFRQWRKAATLARGEFLWIAEADDISRPDFLTRLTDLLSADRDMAFAFCDSFEIDANGADVKTDFKTYYAALGDQGLAHDGVFDRDAFLRRFLFPRNLVLNASAVVWRTQRLRDIFDRLGEQAFAFDCAGDWQLYVDACQPGATIGYVADSLNGFRRHQNSVTHRLARGDHLAEIERVLGIVIDRAGDHATLRPVMDRQLAQLERIWATR